MLVRGQNTKRFNEGLARLNCELENLAKRNLLSWPGARSVTTCTRSTGSTAGTSEAPTTTLRSWLRSR